MTVGGRQGGSKETKGWICTGLSRRYLPDIRIQSLDAIDDGEGGLRGTRESWSVEHDVGEVFTLSAGGSGQ